DNNGQVCRVCLQFSLCSLATAKVPLKYKDFGGFGASGCCVVLDHWLESTLGCELTMMPLFKSCPWHGTALSRIRTKEGTNKQTNSKPCSNLIMRHSLTIITSSIHPHACLACHCMPIIISSSTLSFSK
ncbi:hypothetical protein VIGAN_10186400, partial [Vigna angularis var. angularis]